MWPIIHNKAKEDLEKERQNEFKERLEQNRRDHEESFMNWLMLIICAVVIIICLVGCSPQNVQQQVVIKKELVMCEIPDSYFLKEKLPSRSWNWADKHESDVLTFLQEHRTVINKSNLKLEKIKKVQDNCRAQITEANKKNEKH